MSEIYDPLAIFDAETTAQEAGVRDPKTGIRQPYNKAEREALRNEEIKRKSQVAKHALAILMQNDLGREWLYDQLTLCNVFGTPYTPDAQLTAYNAGAMFYGRMLENDIKKHFPKEYFILLEEGWSRDRVWNEDVADKA